MRVLMIILLFKALVRLVFGAKFHRPFSEATVGRGHFGGEGLEERSWLEFMREKEWKGILQVEF
jgi:hypothetical protein